MFFIAGISNRVKSLGRYRCVCPVCGRACELYISKEYSVFTFFFIPIIPFGSTYLASCSDCSSVMALSKEKGKALERDPGAVIYSGDLQILQNNAGPACPACGAKIIANQNFCYHCGASLL